VKSDRPAVTLVGSGLAGALMAIYLGRRGYRVRVFERRPDLRQADTAGGRSINLALSARGLAALEGVGLEERILSLAIPMRGRMMHGQGGRLTYQPYSKDPTQSIKSVSRGGLNNELLSAAEATPGVILHFSERCLDVDLDASAVTFLNETTGKEHEEKADFVIGADGAFSAVRARLQKSDRFDYEQSYLAHGYKELTIPAAPGGGHRMEKHALHIWPRGSFMMIALANLDGSFTCTLFWPFSGPNSFEALETDEQLLTFFEKTFPDALPLLPDLARDYRSNPTGSLVTIRCGPWYHGGRVVLLGDAAHAVVPFYGQGMNAAFEDCIVLDRCLEQAGHDLARAFSSFYAARKDNADALADLAIENFLEMRDRVASRRFLLRKRVERTLHRLFPRAFVPVYSLVSFSLTPYAEARARGRAQERILRGLLIGTVALAVLLPLLVLFLLLR
jgi:kynurenine 3-monooxygenase